MYIIYCLFASLIMSLIYEYSGISGIGIKNVILSFLLFMIINLIITKPTGRYKRNIVIFSFFATLFSIANTTKVRFQFTEISFFDFKLIKAAGGIAGLFLDKIPYAKISVITLSYIAFVVVSKFYVDIFNEILDNLQQETLEKIETVLYAIDKFFYKKYSKFVPVILLSLFFVFTNAISSVLSASSFSSLIISSKTIVQTFIRGFEDEEKMKKRIFKAVENDKLSYIDTQDELMKGYPFNKQSDMDIIIIQSETFFDLPKYQDVLGEGGIVIRHEKDIHENFHYYQKNGISGKFYTPTVGGGTVNTEYEVLTGYGARYFARGTIVFTSILDKQMNSIAYFLKENIGNMKTIAIHNHDADFWDRDRVYPLLGIDEFIDMTMFTEQEQKDLVGAWMSDKTIFDMTIRQLEANKDTNNFIFPVTVQNHGPFIENRGDYIEIDNLSENDRWEIYNFVSNLKYSDEQLKIFMDYIDNRQKPTMVVFYGDHKPDSNYDIFKNSRYYTENEKIRMFETDYFIYFNDAVKDEKLRALKGTEADLSASAMNRYLQILLGDTSILSMYLYNYSKKPENYFNRDIMTGLKDSIFRDISVNFINKNIEY